MKTINIIIDDKPITVPEGTNIFQAALDNGIYIPGLCYHPRLSQFGGCRLCMVEVTERRTGHRFACAHPVSEGMMVKVNTPKVVRYRRSVMEYLLAHHELSCPTCDKSGECGLQDITHELSLAPSRFHAVRMNAPIVRDNPVLELNRNRCVLCGRCVSACKEIEGVGAIDFQKRGIQTYIGTAFDKPLECSFCGSCLSVCPTGSWQDRTFAFRGRAWELKKTQTICPYCAVGCTIILNTKSAPARLEEGMETVRRVTSDDRLGINEGNLCIKGRFGYGFIHAEERIKTPLLRKNGELCPVTWDEALGHVSERFQQIISEHGGRAIAGIGSEKGTNEDNYLFQKFCRSVLGTNTIDNLANMRSPSLNSLIYQSVTYGFTATSLREIEVANTLFFFGADVTEAHPVIGNMARKAVRMNGANLIVANVRRVTFRSAAKNDIRLQYSFGSQVEFIHALIKTILDEKLVDLKRVEQSADNLNELLSGLDNFSGENASQLTGIPPEAMRKAAAVLTKPGHCCIICGKDIEEDPLAEDIIKALMNLCALINAAYNTDTGYGKVSLLFSRSHNNTQGVNDMGVVPGFLPGYIDINDVSHKEKIERVWGTSLSSDIFQKESASIFDCALQGKLRGIYIMGANPVIHYPNGKEVLDALRKIDFLVVQDTFLTETARLANIVLPVVTFAEKEGTFTNMGMTVQRLNRAIQPVGDAKPDWQIICELARRMGSAYSYTSPKDILNEIESIVPIYSGINYDRLKRKEFYWVSSVLGRNKPIKYTFTRIRSKSLDVKRNTGFPLALLTGVSLNHQGAFSQHSKVLRSVAPACHVEINKKDAKEMNIQSGDTVVVESPQKKITLQAKVTDKVPDGVVFVSEDYEWIPVNLLRNGEYTFVKISRETG
ncbi:MAG: 2Fe-2S iron-sulfur cluster binding domain-containing protein [wastewater metagenome]|nr:2Fe-2S iron-sulfur cluster binding domain-containing protein [Candidatus Loosdrechtia aerotolerans]